MDTAHNELLRKVEQFQLDSAEATLPFSARLARENNWTTAYALRVIAEYKRFAFLAVAAGHPVSPPEDVDQAWHLHLTYSENYWKAFCPLILGRPLHHQPTQGGASERDKFDDWYSRTIESYRALLGKEPPEDIWPAPEARRKGKHSFVRVDRERNWVIRKPRLQVNSRLPMLSGVIALAIFCMGTMTETNPLNWRGPDFLEFYFILLTVCFGISFWLRRSLRQPGRSDAPQTPDLDGYTVAYLNGGKILTVNTAIASLIRQRALRLDAKAKRLVSLVPDPEFTHPIEQAVYTAANSPDGNTMAAVREAAKPCVTPITEDLQGRGLVVANEAARKAIAFPLVLVLAAIMVGVIKIFIGLSRGKPVEYLTVLCVVSFLVSLFTLARRPLRSRQGDAVLAELQNRHVGSRRIPRNIGVITAAEFVTIMGLFGMTALAGSELTDLRRSLLPTASSGSSGCGTSCGGGCGGGCGGCGGGH